MKRSQAVSLVLLAGAGGAALVAAHFDPTQKEEDALIYRSEQECVDAAMRPSGECHSEFEAAQAAYLRSAPRYETRSDCQAHHGAANCRSGEEAIGSDAARVFVPVMAAYLIGRTAGQSLPVQPLYNHPDERQDEGRSSGHAGGYCTGAGGRVYAASGGSVSRVSSATARASTAAPRVVARGGFGSTGHSVAAASSSAHASAGHAGS